MFKHLTPVAAFAACLAIQPAEAKTCPTGQMYRVKLGVCQPRAANLKYLGHAAARPHARPHLVARLKALPPERPPEFAGETTSAGEAASYAPQITPAPPTLDIEAEAASPSGVASPYGALR